MEQLTKERIYVGMLSIMTVVSIAALCLAIIGYFSPTKEYKIPRGIYYDEISFGNLWRLHNLQDDVLDSLRYRIDDVDGETYIYDKDNNRVPLKEIIDVLLKKFDLVPVTIEKHHALREPTYLEQWEVWANSIEESN